MQVDVVKLYGAMELAPKVNLASAIVDLVDTGTTLKANNLMELYKIADVSSRLIVNPTHYKTKFKQLSTFICKLERVLEK